MMGNAFYPDEWLDSAYDIPYEQFYQKGMRGIIFDIDNTLVPHGAPADERAVQLFERLRAIGFHTCLLSNNKEARVAPFAGQVGSDYIYKGRKPKRSGYRQAMRRMGTGERSTMFVGDQLFTDVYGARRTGIYSILVKPLNPKEEIQLVLKRYLETIVLWFYVRRQEKIVEGCSRVFLNGLKELARRQNRMLTGVPETVENQLFQERISANLEK